MVNLSTIKEIYHEYKTAFKTLILMAWPNMLTFFASLCIPVSSTIAVGHLGSATFIGSAALGNMFANASGFAVGSGLAMALDTLCSQAFGAKKYKLVGLHCQRAMTLLTLISIPIMILWWNASFVLNLVGSAETAALSQFWLRRLIPSAWPRMMYEAYRRYLLGQRILWPITLSVVIGGACHVLNTYLFVFYFGWGFAGAAWATSLSYWILFFNLVAWSYIRVIYLRRKAAKNVHHKLKTVSLSSSVSDSIDDEESDLDEEEEVNSLEEGVDEPEEEDEENGDPLHTWPDWSMNVFRGWLSYLQLGIPTTLSLFIEWGSFEVNAVIASQIGDTTLAAHAIVCNTASLWYSPSNGLAAATTALVGNMLGAKEPVKAFRYTKVAYAIVYCFSLLNGGLGLIYGPYLGRLFTNDEAVISLIAGVMPVFWFYTVVDSAKAVGAGVLRGTGRPKITVVGNALSCFVIGYPLALFMVFKMGYGLNGLWFGMASAWLSSSFIYLFIVLRTNWDEQVHKAELRNAEALLSIKRLNKSEDIQLTKVETSNEDKVDISDKKNLITKNNNDTAEGEDVDLR